MDTIWALLKALFWLIVIGSFAHAFLSYFMLWVEKRLLSEQAGNTNNFNTFDLSKGFLIEFFCVFTHCVLYPLGFRNAPPKILLTEKNSTPILLVHGYLHNQISWLWFAKTLRKNAGVGPIYSLNLSSPFASIETFASEVQEKVKEIQTETNAKKIILIGHSMGGLVSSYFAEHLAKPEDIAAVIALGSPFQGTRVSALGFGQNVKQMFPHSAFSVELKKRIGQSTIPYYTILSKVDNLIIPWQSALIDTLPENRCLILEDHGHLRLLISPVVVDQVLKWIRL